MPLGHNYMSGRFVTRPKSSWASLKKHEPSVLFSEDERADATQLHPPQRSLSDQQDWGKLKFKAQTKQRGDDIDQISCVKDKNAKQSSNGRIHPSPHAL